MAVSITCPRCGRTSYNKNDIAEGYCGYCNDWTADEPEPGNTFRDGKIHVMDSECENCLFHPKDRLVGAATVKELVGETKDYPGATFTCHLGQIAHEDAICRGWYDHFGDRDPILALARQQGIIQEQSVSETKAKITNGKA